MHDFLKTDSKIGGYSFEVSLFGLESRQGFDLTAGSPGNSLIHAIALREIGENSDSFKIGGNLKEKKIVLTAARDEKKNAGEIWRKNFCLSMDQSGLIDEDFMPGGEVKVHFGTAGKPGGFIGETILTAMGSKAVEIQMNLELESQKGAIHITQAMRPGKILLNKYLIKYCQCILLTIQRVTLFAP